MAVFSWKRFDLLSSPRFREHRVPLSGIRFLYRSGFLVVLCLCAFLVSVPAAVAELVGEWSMDGGLQDSATNAAPDDAAVFTVSGFGTSGADGFGPPDFQDASLFGSSIIAENLGSALRLHENDELGKYQRLWIPDTYFGTAPDYNDNWTVSMWFCRADADNNDFLIYAGTRDGFGDGSPAFQIWINCLDPHPLNTLGVTNYRPTDVTMYSEPITSREWHHMAFVFSENSSGSLYLDAQLVATDYQMTWILLLPIRGPSSSEGFVLLTRLLGITVPSTECSMKS